MANNIRPRIAFVDLLFCWPPNGGADVDLYHVLEALSHRNFEIKLYVPHFEGVMGRGTLSIPTMPFPVDTLEIPPAQQTETAIITAIQTAVTSWNPDAVILTHGYALKAPLALALRQYPLAAVLCPRIVLCPGPTPVQDNQPCPLNYLDHPESCRRCALKTLGRKYGPAVPGPGHRSI